VAGVVRLAGEGGFVLFSEAGGMVMGDGGRLWDEEGYGGAAGRQGRARRGGRQRLGLPVKYMVVRQQREKN
jgi:hypothetical protein